MRRCLPLTNFSEMRSIAPRTRAGQWNGHPRLGANHHLRQSLVFLDVPTMAQPEAYIGNAATMFDDKGALIDDSTREFMRKFLGAFARWIERNAST